MAKPSRFYVEYEDPEQLARMRQREAEGKSFDLSDAIAWEDGFEDFESARVAMRLYSQNDKYYACVRERQNLVDESSPGVPPWTAYDSEDEIVAEAG